MIEVAMILDCNKVICHFGKLYLPLTALVIIITSAIYYMDNSARTGLLKNQEYHNVLRQEEIIKNVIQEVSSDLKVLSQNYDLKQYIDGKVQDTSPIQHNFFLFIKEKRKYDQIRFISANGMEQVRVNWQPMQPHIVPQYQLQNKSDRYYFKNTMSLKQNEIFISPFDLNIENSELEQPIKPMLRLAMPVFNSAGLKAGIVIINYAGKHILERLREFDNGSKGSTLLLNQDSYYLTGLNSDDEWRFMYPGKEQINFMSQFPAEWNTVLTQNRSQFLNNHGLFTSARIYPLSENLHIGTGVAGVLHENEKQFTDNNYFWILVSYMKPSELKNQRWIVYLLGTLFLLIVLGVYSWKNALANYKRLAAEKALEVQATHDPLTQLPNRKLLYDRLAQTLALSERKQRQFALLFIDLDKFKEINDTYGHEAGDIVLQQTALRMADILRKADTLARIGGDEFVVLIPDIDHSDSVGIIAEKLITVIRKPVRINSESQVAEPCIGASIGISLYPRHGKDIDTLINAADKAMYDAKQMGRNRLCIAPNNSGNLKEV